MSQKILEQLVPHKQMQFQPVEEDDDELSEFIKSDPLTHDNMWDLHDTIDPEQLDAFWADALKELGPLEAEQDEEEPALV